MARRPKQQSIPAKPKKQSTVFQGNGPKKPVPAYEYNLKNGAPHNGLTTNRQKPGGGAGSGGGATSV